MTNAATGRGTGYRRARRRWENDHDVRFMTFSCFKRLPLLRHPSIKEVFVRAMCQANMKHAFSLYAYVVMPEHVRMIFRPAPGGRWSTIGQSIKISVARQAIDRWKELDAPILSRLRTPSGLYRFWQHGGGFDRNIRDREELAHEFQYTHRNPVRRGLVERPEDWEWSSVHAWMGRQRPDQPACERPPGDAEAWRAWRGFQVREHNEPWRRPANPAPEYPGQSPVILGARRGRVFGPRTPPLRPSIPAKAPGYSGTARSSIRATHPSGTIIHTLAGCAIDQRSL